ncbi:MAG: hypothetical protein R3E95_11330 [Thiolinea sp.]
MKRYLLIFILLFSFLANGVVMADSGCCMPAGDSATALPIADHAHHEAGKLVDAGPVCLDDDLNVHGDTHDCMNCLAHCSAALPPGLAVASGISTSFPRFLPATGHFPNVYFSLLRPPQYS